MRFLRYIDSKFTLYDQKAYIISFIFFGVPLGYSFVQIMTILISGWEKYHFSMYNLIGNLTTNFLILSPFLINYIRHTKRFKKIYKKVIENSKNVYRVKALFTYSPFIKGSYYEICKDSYIMNFDKKNIIFIIDDNKKQYPIKNIINKFELDDIKEDRLRKLKKLKRIW